MAENPFFTGNPVNPANFVNRARELRRVTGRILSGQSSIITGEPRSGKTSLLHYLKHPQQQAALYGDQAAMLMFRYFDVDALSDQFTQADFWARALEPLEERLAKAPAGLREAYDVCAQNHYTTFTLEKLLAQVQQAGLRLVLLIDEVDRLLGHASLNNAEFYGGLRSLTTRSNGALALVLAARQSVAQLNTATQQFSRTGSPYFNFLEEIPLRPFGQRSALQVLARAQGRFSAEEQKNILFYADGHPYYLQAAASALWETYEDLESDESDLENTPEKRWSAAYQAFYQKVSPNIQDTWNVWSPAMRKALAILALDEIPTILGEKRFNLEKLHAKLSLYDPEIKTLAYTGFIKEDPELPGGWQISAKVMLLWIGDALLRGLRDEAQATQWLAEQEWDGMFTRQEKEQLTNAAKGLVEWLPKLKALWQLFA
ncbi:MAG: hypothetical protein Fur0018_03530 [Anaerolineales bacterium]